MTKTALITGGSRGIGKCVVDLLRGMGWDVIAPTRREFDMNDPTGVELWIKQSGLERLDAVVFCHGTWYSKPLPEQGGNDYLDQLQTRLLTPLAVFDNLFEQITGGCIIFVSSTQALDGGFNTLPYAAGCAAQIRAMRGISNDNKHRAIRCNAIACGLTDTDMAAQVRATGGAKPDAIAQPPGVVAAEIVRLIESDDNGRVMRVVNSEVTEAKWSW